MIYLLMIIALVLAVTFYIRLLTSNLINGEECRKEFSLITHKLINDDQVPDIVADYLAVLHDNMFDKTFMRFLFIKGFSGKLRHVKKETKMLNLIKAVDDMPHEQQKGYYKAVGFFIIANTYNNVFLGTLARRLLLWSMEESKKATSAAVYSEARERHWFNGNENIAI